MREDAVVYDQLSEVERRRRYVTWLTELAQLAQTLPVDGVQQLRVCRDRFHNEYHPDEVAPLSAQSEGAR